MGGCPYLHYLHSSFLPRSQAPLENAVRGAPLHRRGKVSGATQESRYTGEVELENLSAFGAELRERHSQAELGNE
jgi:hypothetical protein